MPRLDDVTKWIAILLGLYILLVYYEGTVAILNSSLSGGASFAQTLQGINPRTGEQRAYARRPA